MDTIPLIDLKAQYAAHKDEFDEVVRDVIESARFIGGEHHEKFAEEFAEFCGGGHVALCNSGTDALRGTLRTLMPDGGEVITVSQTFTATVDAIIWAGLTPVLVDIDPDTYLMDLGQVEGALTDRTRGIIAVHLYGQMVPMDGLADLAKERGLTLIEDAAQAHGATWQGEAPGMWGDAACFSFYPGKNLGAWGDGGAVFSRDEETIKFLRAYFNHGREGHYLHRHRGVNSRMDALQAAVLRVKLRHLLDWNEKRRALADFYNRSLADRADIKTPVCDPQAVHAYHQYVLQVADRDGVKDRMAEAGVSTAIHYPIPLHEQPCNECLGLAPEALPISHRVCKRVLSLPMFAEITDAQRAHVVEQLKLSVSP